MFAHSHSPLPERVFIVVEHDDGRETIGFDGGPSPGRALDDSRLAAEASAADAAPADNPRIGRRKTINTFAVSRVELDADGRVVAVLWGRVDTANNAWASGEVVVPVAEVVRALRAGDLVFALFPSTHGHVPSAASSQLTTTTGAKPSCSKARQRTSARSTTWTGCPPHCAEIRPAGRSPPSFVRWSLNPSVR